MTVKLLWIGRSSCGKVLSSLKAINTGICVAQVYMLNEIPQ